MQKLYTTETLAELLQVSPRTIRRERKEGRLPFVRVRGQIRYRESDVRAYLEHNATRNRALDLLPLLAEMDEARVRARVNDPLIKPRPAYHYRLPNCSIERTTWSLAEAWNLWVVVEQVAESGAELDELGRHFRDAHRPLLGVSRSGWVEHVEGWLWRRGWA